LPYNPPYIPVSKSIETSGIGLRELSKFYAQTIGAANQTFVLDLSTMNHVDANLASVLAAMHYSLAKNKNKLILRFAGATFYVFKRNGFISYCEGKPNDPSVSDERQSTIPLRSFLPEDGEAFTSYLKKDFFGHRGATDLTYTEVNNLTGHFTEVFENVFMHAETTEPVFTCGQYYPQAKELKFTLVDMGSGFLKKIHEKTGGSVKSEALAIQWALLGKSTRDIEKFGPGGGILKAIQTYCKQHNGSLLIVSGAEYCNAGAGPVESGKLACRFNGSIVSLILRNLLLK
jgi:hypothetical protein